MILDLDTVTATPPRPQVAVLGAGAVGIVVAVALARRGVRVVLCESGGRTVEPEAQSLNEAVLIGRSHAGIATGRARLLGGTTNLWGGQLVSFKDIDFRSRPWLGLDAWPVSRSTIAPYYATAARMLQLQSDTDDDTRVWEEIGLTRPEFGPDIEIILTRWLKEPNLARLFRSDLRRNPNLTVLLHASATSFQPGEEYGAIRAVKLRSPAGKEALLEADHFVVATGTIEASRLLLAAAMEYPTLPWAGNPHVGRCFQDHVELRAGRLIPVDRKRFSDIFDNIVVRGFKYSPKVTLTSQAQESLRISNVVGNFTFESSVQEHLTNLKLFVRAIRRGVIPPNLKFLPRHLSALTSLWRPLIVRYLKDRRIFNPADLGITFWVHCEQKPLKESRILLSPDKRDANGMPLAMLDWRVDGSEVRAARALCERLSLELEKRKLATLGIDPRILADDSAIIAEGRDTNHHCGGLRMAARPEDGVVDPDCRVFGAKNLHVAGAAVFPSSSFANPTFTAMALGLRLVDRIAESA